MPEYQLGNLNQQEQEELKNLIKFCKITKLFSNTKFKKLAEKALDTDKGIKSNNDEIATNNNKYDNAKTEELQSKRNLTIQNIDIKKDAISTITIKYGKETEITKKIKELKKLLSQKTARDLKNEIEKINDPKLKQELKNADSAVEAQKMIDKLINMFEENSETMKKFENEIEELKKTVNTFDVELERLKKIEEKTEFLKKKNITLKNNVVESAKEYQKFSLEKGKTSKDIKKIKNEEEKYIKKLERDSQKLKIANKIIESNAEPKAIDARMQSLSKTTKMLPVPDNRLLSKPM